MTKAIFLSTFTLFSLLFAPIIFAVDVVRMNTGNQANDLRVEYKLQVLTLALEKSKPEFGPYRIDIIEIPTTAGRALIEVQSGETLNLFMGVTTAEWEAKNLPIRIPIRRGILNYRVLAVNKTNLQDIVGVQNINDLKKRAVGVRLGWATTTILKQNGFKVYELESLDGLYHMLNRGAIDYIPRGINEIFDEIAVRQPNNLAVDDSLILHIPAPTYVIVSPHETRLAKRIESGLEIMVADGSLKKLFYQFYADDIKKIDFKNRTIIPIHNPDMPKHIPFERKELWYSFDEQQGEQS